MTQWKIKNIATKKEKEQINIRLKATRAKRNVNCLNVENNYNKERIVCSGTTVQCITRYFEHLNSQNTMENIKLSNEKYCYKPQENIRTI